MITTTDVVGTPTNTVWTQAQATIREDGSCLVLVVRLTCSQDSDLADLAEIGGQLLLEFPAAVTHVSTSVALRDVLHSTLANVASGVTVEVLSAIVSDDRLIALGEGDIALYMVRAGQLVRVVDSNHIKEGVTGNLLLGDRLLFATNSFIDACGLSFIEQSLGGDDAAEALAPIVHQQLDSSAMAGVVVLISGGAAVVPEEKRSWLATITAKLPTWGAPLRVVRETGNGRRRVTTAIGMAILVLLLILIPFGYIRRTQQVRDQAYAAVTGIVGQDIASAEAAAGTNPDQAKLFIDQGSAAATGYMQSHLSEPYLTKAKALVSNVQTASAQIFKITPVTPQTLVQLSVLSDGLATNNMAADGNGNILFADTHTPQIVGMNLSDKSKFILSAQSLGAVTATTAFGKTIYGLVSGGVFSATQAKPTPQIVITPDDLWQHVVQMGSYAGNLYLFDQGASEIWKYPVLDTGFGAKQRWFAVGITPDLSNVVDMQVTGDIWLVTSTGKLLKYTHGAPVTLTFAGFPAVTADGTLSDPTAVAVDSGNVYVLERGARRVDVFGTDGTYERQYTADEFGQGTDLVVTGGKGYVLEGGTVRWFGL